MSGTGDIRVLVSGGDGFVAPFAARAIRAALPQASILYTARHKLVAPAGCAFAELDVTDPAMVRRRMADFRPSHVLHLAAIASRKMAEDDPALAWAVNVAASTRLAAALGECGAGRTFVHVSSSQIYDRAGPMPLHEGSAVRPEGVYAETKAAGDAALATMASARLRVLRFRPFNHTGPGQPPAYAFGSFAAQIAAIEAGRQEPVLRVGNLELMRDFLDVRDVARAYAMAIAATDLPADLALNIASGQPKRLDVLLDAMLAAARTRIAVEADPALLRTDEPAVIIGDSSKAKALLGWQPQIAIEATLKEMVDHARNHVP